MPRKPSAQSSRAPQRGTQPAARGARKRTARGAARARPVRPSAPPYDALEKQLIAALEPVPGMAIDGPWPGRAWTREIRARLGLLGQQRGYQVYADGCLGAEPQWLYLVVWAVVWAEGRGGHLRQMQLAAEYEWNLNLQEIAEDFDKLLQARARHRLMIFEQRNAADVAMVLRALKARVRAFRGTLPGDRFLFAAYDFGGACFQFDLHVA